MDTLDIERGMRLAASGGLLLMPVVLQGFLSIDIYMYGTLRSWRVEYSVAIDLLKYPII